MAALTRTVTPLLATAAWTASAQPSAAPADAVIAHFRDYRAALQRDDLRAAEAAAAAALRASEDTTGRRTAVLALNLANVRLELGGPNALPSARIAFELATASADSGVDPTAAALTLGRAELAAGQRAGVQRILDALAAADGRAALETDAYNAAVALGTWGIEVKEYETARSAWSRAARFTGTTDDPPLARARALTGEGTSIALAGMERAASEGRRARAFQPADVKAANDAFSIALRLLQDRALADSAWAAGATPAQHVYAQALAWQAVVLAKNQSAGGRPPLPLPIDADVPPLDDSDRCALRVIREGTEIQYPAEALDPYGVGAVVVQLGLDADGATASRTIAAAVPPGRLSLAVAAVMGEWRTVKDPSAAPSCRRPGSLFVPVRFTLYERR